MGIDNISKSVVDLSTEIIQQSSQKILEYYPMDRFFLEKNGYIDKIKNQNWIEFLTYNFELKNPIYSVQLSICLPEIWDRRKYNDFIKIIRRFTNVFSFYAFIEFTYKYLEVNLIEDILKDEYVLLSHKSQLINYLLNVTDTLYLSESDYFDFNEVLFGVNIKQLEQLREQYFLDDRFSRILSRKDLYEFLIMYHI